MELQMKITVKIEEFFMLGLAIYLFAQLEYAWWWYPLLFFTPDLSILAYYANPKIGAVSYNLAHHKGIAIALLLLGYGLAVPLLQLTGLVLFGHASFDRLMGYGLKYPDSFKHTHLGMIGE